MGMGEGSHVGSVVRTVLWYYIAIIATCGSYLLLRMVGHSRDCKTEKRLVIRLAGLELSLFMETGEQRMFISRKENIFREHFLPDWRFLMPF